MLRDCVSPRDGLVDYVAAGRHRASLTKLIKALAAPRSFASPKQRLAVLLNAYNVLVIVDVLDRGVTAGVADHPGFFDRDRFNVLGESVTLDVLRDQMIRPLGDPRVHVALVGGAMGFPPLRGEPYTAAALDRQLDDQARRFVGDRVHNGRIGSMLLLSPLFREFAADFAAGPDRGVPGFLRRYADPRSPIGQLLRQPGEPAIGYQAFNWALNQSPN